MQKNLKNAAPVIKIEGLTKDYGSGRGVFNVSFSVNEGEVFGFLGPNGAGKSTTIRHLMGFSRPDKGSVEIFGLSSFEKYGEILNRVGYIPGEVALPAGLTGREFINMIINLQNAKPVRLNEMLELFELSNGLLSCETKRMSLGVKRKLAVVSAFMSDPAVLILDEPTSGLDPVMQEKFVKLIRAEKERGKTILLSSHIFTEIDSTCDRIAIIKDGKIVSQFVADDLKHASRKYYDVSFASGEELTGFLNKSGDLKSFLLISRAQKSAYFSVEDSDLNALIAMLSQCGVRSFGNRRESLEDYFMSFYKEDKNFGGALR